MLRGKGLFFTIVSILVLSLALVGCTQDPAKENGNDTNKEDPSSESENVDDSLDRVLDAGVLTVVGSGDYPPFNFYDENDNVVGFDVDTGEEIAKRLGVELNYETSAWDGLPDGLRAGRYDAILGSMAITEERLEVVSFTIPYYYSGAQLIVRKDSGITDAGQMEGKEIGVVTGETFMEDAQNLGAGVVPYEGVNQILMELLNGRVDGMITDRLVALNGMNQIKGGDDLTLAGDLLRLEEMALAVKQEDNKLREKLDEILQEMHNDGTLIKISEKWHEGRDITVK
ncbi:MAG: transporter substrate-binding domain-containing protein [Bacillota bacterium]